MVSKSSPLIFERSKRSLCVFVTKKEIDNGAVEKLLDENILEK